MISLHHQSDMFHSGPSSRSPTESCWRILAHNGGSKQNSLHNWCVSSFLIIVYEHIRADFPAGAGPSGLVAAKALTSLPPSSSPAQFYVTIFEKTTRIGGLWPSSQISEDDRLVNPSMCTNQSRHTVSFSDLAWPGPDEKGVEKYAQFPKAWEVGQYLERYLQNYGSEWEVRLGCKVVKAEMKGEHWNVHVTVTDSTDGVEPGERTVEVHEFDHVIVATGFFGAPNIPASLTLEKAEDVPVWHSSRFRDVRNLITDGGRLKVDSRGNGDGKRKIVVVGGQMSGVEVAAKVALQLSDCVNAPGKEIMHWEEWEVVHIVQRPVWVLPLFLPRNPQIGGSGKDKKVRRISQTQDRLLTEIID